MATDKLEDVWAARDFPVLVEVARRFDAGALSVRREDVADATGLDVDTVQLAGLALSRRGLVETKGAMQAPVLRFTNVAGAAYLLTGLHPDGDDVVSQLVSALQQAAAQQSDEDERGRLRRAADAIGGVSRDVITGVLTAVITKSAGM